MYNVKGHSEAQYSPYGPQMKRYQPFMFIKVNDFGRN